MTKPCVSCGKSAPDVKFSGHHRTCNKCLAERNRDYMAEYSRNKRSQQTDADRAYHADRIRKGRVKNPHLTFYQTSRYLAKKAGVFSDLTKEDALDLNETPNTCGYCAKEIDVTVKRALHIDHIVPMSQGGVNSRWNLVKSCINCNTSKGDGSLIDFYERTPEFTYERYEAVVIGMTRLSQRSRTDIDAILTQSRSFEIAYETERQRMMGALLNFTA